MNSLWKLRLIAEFLTCSSLNDLYLSSATRVNDNLGGRQQLCSIILTLIYTINLCVNVRSFISCWSRKMGWQRAGLLFFFLFLIFLVGLHLIRPRAIWLAYVSIIDNVLAMFELGEEEVRTWEYTKLGGRISPRLIRCVCVREREIQKILKIVSITHLMHLMRAALPRNAKDNSSL